MAVSTGITNEVSWWSAVGWEYHWYKVNENKEGEGVPFFCFLLSRRLKNIT